MQKNLKNYQKLKFISKKLKREFFTQPTLKVAKKLLGKYIVRKIGNNFIIGKIIETEAYIGPFDKASHAYSKKEQSVKEKLKIIHQNWERIKNHIDDKEKFIKKILKLKNAKVTKKNLAEYLRGGHIYIYLVYGNYYQLNITTYREGYPECVLIRALEPITAHKPDPNGPGKLCQFLRLDSSFWSEDLIKNKKIWLVDGEDIKNKDVVKKTRVGIDYAEEHKYLLWRFYIKTNKWVSKK